MPPPGARMDPVIEGLDRLGFKMAGLFTRLFGSLAAKNEEVFWAAIKGTGNGYVDLAATVGATGSASIQVSQEADLVGVRALAASVNPGSGALLTTVSWSAQVKDGSSDREMMSYPIHSECLVGNARESVPFPKTRLFRRNSTITVDFTNLQAVATRIYLVLMGYKVFDESALDLTRRR